MNATDAPPRPVFDVLDWINPTERQRDFLRATRRADYTLYGGAAGGGKSYVLRRALVYMLMDWAARGHKNVRVGLFCENFPVLQDRHLASIRYEFPSDIGTMKESTHEFTLAPRFGSGVIAFRNLDDPSKYLSAEFAAIAVDELTRNPRSVFDFLRMRMRWKGIERTKFIAATNPGGPGHGWVKSLWIDRDFTGDNKPLADDADQFAYVQAKASDNPHLAKGYYERLLTLPGQLARAYAEGDWTIFAGQVFTEFRLETHTCKPFEVPAWWQCWLCNDPAQAEHSAWFLLAASEGGQVFVVKEWTFKGEWHTVQAATVAADLKEMGRTPSMKISGLDAFQPRFERGKGIVDLYGEGGLMGWEKPNPDGHPGRMQRAGMVHEYLKPIPTKDGEHTAKLQIFDTCRNLIRTLPTLTANEKHPEEVAECDADHWFDGLSYGLVAWHTRRSTAPAKPAYKAGSAGDVLAHSRRWIEDDEAKNPQGPWRFGK